MVCGAFACKCLCVSACGALATIDTSCIAENTQGVRTHETERDGESKRVSVLRKRTSIREMGGRRTSASHEKLLSIANAHFPGSANARRV